MRADAYYPQFTIKAERDEIETRTIGDFETVPDPDWKHVDKKGHGHFWDGPKLPTLTETVIGTGHYDDGETYDITQHVCKLCDEPVEPGYRRQTPKPIFGETTITVQFDNEEFRLTVSQYAASIQAWQEALRSISKGEHDGNRQGKGDHRHRTSPGAGASARAAARARRDAARDAARDAREAARGT